MHNSVNKLTVIRWVVVWYMNNLSIKLFYKTELTEWIHGPFVEFPTKVLFYHHSVEARMLKWILHIAWISLSFVLSFFLPPYPPPLCPSYMFYSCVPFHDEMLKSTLCFRALKPWFSVKQRASHFPFPSFWTEARTWISLSILFLVAKRHKPWGSKNLPLTK